ncbi:dienelactone hydrolase family protein [Phenylobacterium sp.]|uniref:dienelactone hydrolase family protein n=1 Tax=Phenylobacterium sp. TaxID=1871053 RepID=UPI0035B2EF54
MTMSARFVRIPPLQLGAELRIPDKPRGLVIFAHGSGSSRFSPRNQSVAQALVASGFSTLLLDLLTEDEAQHRANVFDIDRLGARLVDAIDWAGSQPELADLPIGLFGASTGAAAALQAAALRPRRVRTVISRGGRPDLAHDRLAEVEAPVLLIVGSQDEPVLTWNREALMELNAASRLEVVDGATHLFEEPGALYEVVRLAIDWCQDTLASPARPGRQQPGAQSAAS